MKNTADVREWIRKTNLHNLKIKDWLALCICIGISSGIGWLFYDSFLGVLFCLPLAYLFFCRYRKWAEKREKRRQLLEFKELLVTLATLLRAGYSIENAWAQALVELTQMYGRDCQTAKVLRGVENRMHLNLNLADAFSEYADTSGLTEIEDFSEVLVIAYRNGGNLVQAIEKTTELIAERIEVEEEITTILTGKILEQRIMCGMPVLMMVYLRLTDREFISPIFHTPIGIATATICLIGTGIAFWWGKRIVDIRV